MFGKKKKGEPHPVEPDNLLADLPRGVLTRKKQESWMPTQFFETPERIAEMQFHDNSGDFLIGAIGGQSELITHANGKSEYVAKGGTLVGVSDDRHILTVAGSRSGKGRAAIVPNLLSYGGGVVVIDPKGENANLTAQYRAESLGQNVYILDPFEITGDHLKKYRKSYNPLTSLSIASRTIIEDAGRIVDSIVIPNPEAKDPHWDQSAKALIECALLHVCTYEGYSAEQRTMVTVSDILTGREGNLSQSLKTMMANGSLLGHIGAAARAFADTPREERGSILSTARRHLKFLDYFSIQSAVQSNDFSLEELRGGKVSIYLCLPSTRLGSCRAFLRMIINLTLGIMDSVLERPEIPILVVMDEFPVLSYMKEIEDAAGQIAGFGVRLWPIVQDLGQLKSIYKTRWETFLGNTGLIQAFGNVDNFTLEYLSKKLGKTTIVTTSKSSQTRDQINERGGTGLSEQERTTALLSPEEIASYFAREDRQSRQLLLLPGKRPLIVSKVPYDQREPFSSRYSRQTVSQKPPL